MINFDYIDKTIKQLKEEGADFNDRRHFSTSYKRYLKRFAKAKALLAVNNDVSGVYPLENPLELIYKAYKQADDPASILERYEREKIDFNILHEFDNLDRLDNHKQ